MNGRPPMAYGYDSWLISLVLSHSVNWLLSHFLLIHIVGEV